MLVATSGHIDHGKSALVRALTGVETDRLPEERARGISIDLGFAYWRPDAGPTIGFVDVPGHERFVRNMIAGLSGIDFAMLVIAADDGIMAQTKEHLRILQLAGVNRLIAVLTKIDRVTPPRIEAVSQSIAELLQSTPYAGAPLFPVNSRDGTGIPNLAKALVAAREEPRIADGEGFRLSIDRAFTVAGAGTIVTGTVTAGRAAVGDAMLLSPAGLRVRIRAMQSAGQDVNTVGRGERCALNLPGVERSEIHRGDWMVAPAGHFPTSRIDASFAVCAERDKSLGHDSHVQFHHGTASIAARVLVPRQRALPPGVPSLIQLVLDTPTSALTSDRFVLRDPSGRELLGGGMVLDPLSSPHRKTLAVREAKAAALGLPRPIDRLIALSRAPGVEPELGWFAACSNIGVDTLSGQLADAGIVRTGKAADIAIAVERFARLEDDLVSLIAVHHAQHPEQGGILRRTARAGLSESVSADLFDSLLRTLAATQRLGADGNLLRLPGHAANFAPNEIEFWRNLCAMHEEGAAKAITPGELAREFRLSDAQLLVMLQRRKASGDLWQITDGKFMLRQHVAGLAALAAELEQQEPDGFTAAEFRNSSGIGRNFVIQLLEFFDRIGVTRRSGEARRMRADWETVVGAARPLRVHK